jgi:hypothetical protein
MKPVQRRGYAGRNLTTGKAHGNGIFDLYAWVAPAQE